MRSVGYSVGAAIGAAIVTAQLAAATGNGSLQDLGKNVVVESIGAALQGFLRGFEIACSTAAVLCFVGAVLSLMTYRKDRPGRA